MTQSSTRRLAQGIVPLTGFALFTAALDVYAGNQFQEHSPVTVAAISFALAAAFFLGIDMLRQGAAATLRPLRTNRYDIIMINITTAVTWLSMLFALKYLEPAIVNVVGLAIGPLITVLLSPLLRPGSSVLRVEILVSLIIGAMIGMLVWGSITGRSGIGELGRLDAMLGVGLTLLTGIGSVANVIYSKRLSDANLKPQSVLALRFFLMLAITWTMVAVSPAPGLAAALLPSAPIAVIGVAVPLYLLQVGIRNVEPITASILLTLSPFFAFVLQLPDQRLTPSVFTLIGIIGITLLVAISTVARLRHDSAAPRVEQPDPTGRSAEASATAPAGTREPA